MRRGERYSLPQNKGAIGAQTIQGEGHGSLIRCGIVVKISGRIPGCHRGDDGQPVRQRGHVEIHLKHKRHGCGIRVLNSQIIERSGDQDGSSIRVERVNVIGLGSKKKHVTRVGPGGACGLVEPQVQISRGRNQHVRGETGPVRNVHNEVFDLTRPHGVCHGCPGRNNRRSRHRVLEPHQELPGDQIWLRGQRTDPAVLNLQAPVPLRLLSLQLCQALLRQIIDAVCEQKIRPDVIGVGIGNLGKLDRHQGLVRVLCEDRIEILRHRGGQRVIPGRVLIRIVPRIHDDGQECGCPGTEGQVGCPVATHHPGIEENVGFVINHHPVRN